jgi:hypothetical protein
MLLLLVVTNPRWAPETRLQGWDQTTADNADLQWWPINLETGNVALSRGSMMLEVSSSGWTISSPTLRVPAPLETVTGCIVHPDIEIAEALLSVLHAGTPDAQRVGAATHWLVKAWQNTPSITSKDRLVFVKTAFEALSGTYKSHLSAAWLKSLFDSTVGSQSVRPDTQLLWQATDAASMVRTWTDQAGIVKSSFLTPLEHWFMALADYRNQIVHSLPITQVKYNEGTAFDGPLFWTAEWILKMTILLELDRLGHKNLWRAREERKWAEIGRAVEKSLVEKFSEAERT